MQDHPADVPALKDGTAPAPEAAIDEPASVLVVDDNPAMLESLAAVVSGMGLEVVTATSGREALRQLLQRDFALVLLDVNMPIMDGFETAALIHGRPRSAHLPIIFVTAEAHGEKDRFRGYDLGAVDFIYSPILPEILRAKIRVFADLFYLNRQLRRQAEDLRARSEEVGRKNLELEQASRMKSEFLATMSHELRTPLNAIIGFADAMRNGLAGDMSAQQREYLGDILASGEHLLALINDILDLSKIEAGKLELHQEEIDIVPLLQNSLSVIRDRAAHRAIHVEFHPEVSGSIRADRRNLRQIIYNLLSNAEKFTPDGGRVTVEVRRVARSVPAEADCVVELETGATATHYLEIKVSDTGIGIDEQERARLFQPFVQLDSSLSRQYQGTGLGLALVKRLVQLHHGCLAVASKPGEGSTFTIWIPYQEGRPAAESTAATTATAPVAPAPLALVIEDDPVASSLIARYLKKEGLQVVEAATGEEGLEQARRLRPQLITLDLRLPGMDGWQCLQEIRQDEAMASVPVVIISMADDATRGIALGATAVLQKPLDEEELTRVLADLNLPHAHEGEQATILVVDDDPRAVELLSLQLESSHYKVLRAYDGREAISTAMATSVDLIILDLMMPELSGFDVVEALQSKSRTACIPVIIITAKDVTQDDMDTLNGFVLRIIGKSRFRGETFINEVHRALLAASWQGPPERPAERRQAPGPP
jgi:signal transduction histidine kinase